MLNTEERGRIEIDILVALILNLTLDELITTYKGSSRINVIFGSPYKAVQVWEYCPVLVCNHLIFRHVLPEDMICNLLTRTAL
jgi:hypothetical protein